MARDAFSQFEAGHPAPHREHAGFFALLFGLVAAPGAWAVHLLASYTLASYVCFPSSEPRTEPLLANAWWVLLAINLIPLAVAVAGLVVANRSWRATHADQKPQPHDLLDVGGERSRFLAMSGIIVSLGFIAAILFDAVSLFLSPLCAY